MKHWKDILHSETFRYIDHSGINTFKNEPYTALTSFAIDDVLTLSVSNKLSPPTMRLWTHDQTVVLGIPDTRLPYIDEGIHFLKEAGYHVIVRNSGGLAVALDAGVLNISLILPGAKQLSIDNSYEMMFSFIKYILKDLTDEIKACEIVGSYCPGSYDLSLYGVKFAGISQRRIKDGAAVQIYLDVEGASLTRAHLIKEFYERSQKGEVHKFTYPTVDPSVMGSLSTLLKRELTIEEIKTRVYTALESLSEQILTTDFSQAEDEVFQRRLKQMQVRNEKIQMIQEDDI